MTEGIEFSVAGDPGSVAALHTDAFARTGQIDNDIAPAVAFLASEEAGWVTGSTVNVDGGHVRH